MKYRLLSDEELQHLEGDLKAFLIINGVEGELWKTLNDQEPEKALALVEMFSDQVLQTVYEKISYLEFRSPDACMVFHCKKDEQELIALNRKTAGNVDLSSIEGIHSALVNHSKDLHVFKTTKAYMDDRELEIHRLLEQGCVLSTKDFWNALEKVIQ